MSPAFKLFLIALAVGVGALLLFSLSARFAIYYFLTSISPYR